MVGVEIACYYERVRSIEQNVNIFWWAVASGAVNREAIDWARF
jgi:hypothetical protein